MVNHKAYAVTYRVYDVVGKTLADQIPTFKRAVEIARLYVTKDTIHQSVVIWDNSRQEIGCIARIDARPGFDWIYEEYRGIALD